MDHRIFTNHLNFPFYTEHSKKETRYRHQLYDTPEQVVFQWNTETFSEREDDNALGSIFAIYKYQEKAPMIIENVKSFMNVN